MAGEEQKVIVQMTLVGNIPKKDIPAATKAIRQLSEHVAEGLVEQTGESVEVSYSDGSSTTMYPDAYPQAASRRSTSLSSIPPDKFEQIFGHRGFKGYKQ